MASRAHQLVAGLVVRKMRQKGYEIVSFDGNEALISDISLKAPPVIRRHRPDIVGVNMQRRKICIGEAKTPGDLDSKRTREQFQDYTDLIVNDSGGCFELIIGILRTSERKLRVMLDALGVAGNPNVSYVWMPEELLQNEGD